MKKLSVNVDHVATLREARKAIEPDPVFAAIIVELSGADGVTVHLRGDRRHINERDLKLIKDVVHIPLTLEMAITDEMISIAKKIKPDVVTIVPEREDEITTEGGLDVIKCENTLKEAIKKLKEDGISICIFIEADKNQIEKAKEVEADSIEIHTGKYAILKGKDKVEELKKIEESAIFGKNIGLEVHAGHGINYKNILNLLKIEEIVEFSIGHSIISRAVFVGLERAIKEMLYLIKGWK